MCGCLGSGQIPETMLVFKGLAVTEAIRIWETCAAADRAIVMFRPELLPRIMSGSIFLLQLRSMLMSMACVATEGHRNHVC